MTQHENIEARAFCSLHNIEISFLDELCDAGLLEMTKEKEGVYISHEHLPELEKLLRWHYELDINIEGIEVIQHLLQQLKHMHREMSVIRERLQLYESQGFHSE